MDKKKMTAESVTNSLPGQEPQLAPNALNVLRNRYLIKDQNGNCIETPGQLFNRTASLVAQAEGKYGASAGQIRSWHKKYYELMASLKFLPNSPTLMNAQRRGTLSACFVLPVEDSIEGIFESVKQTAMIQQAGGGTGFSFDRLRPTGDRIASSGGTTSGPVSFWRVFCETTNAIQQGAFRRGANMGMMSLEHPDILKFLYAKQNLSAFTNFNTSVKITDGWMQKLLSRPSEPHIVTNPRTQKNYLLPHKLDMNNYSLDDLYPLGNEPDFLHKKTGRFYTVGDIWKLIIKCAHATGEPGVVFIDRINQDNPTPSLGSIEATNPCGEQPLLPYEACTLGSINLARFIINSMDGPQVNWQELAETVETSVRFLDNIIDVCDYPVRDTVRLAQANRKIGLGVMGFADCLFRLGIPYDSKQGVNFGTQIMQFVNDNARRASAKLADLRGPFPNWNNSIWRTERKQKVRNASITCVAPTGTISIIADCSAGIEPLYSLVFYRQVMSGKKMLQVNPYFKLLCKKYGFYNKKLEAEILKTGTIHNNKIVPADIRDIFIGAYDISPQWHIRMQAAFQKHCDAAVSKTINLSEKATLGNVDEAYKLAYELGCKGVTVYRRNSRTEEPMSLA
jgi:ribonucleoside-diphosphate reductase alpha chain